MLTKKVAVAVVIGLVVSGCGRGGGRVEEPVPTQPGSDVGFVTDLTVTIEHPDVETLGYRIVCDGETSSVVGPQVVDADAACSRLSNPLVQARLIDGPPAGMACTEIYGGPDVASIEGSIAGVEILSMIDRTNGCGIGDWDDVLADVLPPALGVSG